METIVPIYLECADWESAGKRAVDQNLLQLTSQASTIRVFREVRQRLQCLANETLSNFMDWAFEERQAIALIAACKCYPFIFDFIRLALKDKIQVFDQSLREQDLDVFWNSKAIEHPELEDVAESTKKKLKQEEVNMVEKFAYNTGCRVVSMGIEGGNEKILNKNQTTSKNTIIDAVKRVHIGRSGGPKKHNFHEIDFVMNEREKILDLGFFLSRSFRFGLFCSYACFWGGLGCLRNEVPPFQP